MKPFVSLTRFLTAATLVSALPVAAGAQGIPQRVAELEARLAALEGSSAPQVVEVDCSAGGSVMAALAEAAGRSAPLTIGVRGTCTEQVVVSRDDVSIVGWSPGAGLQGLTSTSPVISVRGGQRLRLSALSLQGGSSALDVGSGASVNASSLQITGATYGVSVSNASVELRGSTIADSGVFGVTAKAGSSVTVLTSTIRDSGFHGVMVTAASLRLGQSVVESNSGGGIFGWAGAMVTIESGTIRDNVGGGLGLQGGATVHFEGTSLIAGNGSSGIGLFFGSSANIRGVTVENNAQSGVSAGGGSVVLFGGAAIVRNNTGPGVRCRTPASSGPSRGRPSRSPGTPTPESAATRSGDRADYRSPGRRLLDQPDARVREHRRPSRSTARDSDLVIGLGATDDLDRLGAADETPVAPASHQRGARHALQLHVGRFKPQLEVGTAIMVVVRRPQVGRRGAVQPHRVAVECRDIGRRPGDP